MVRVDYSKEHFCHQCSLKVSLDLFRCPDCNQKVRTRSHNKNSYYQRVTKPEREAVPRQPDFRVKMRKLRIKRIVSGLKPNIPVPDVT